VKNPGFFKQLLNITTICDTLTIDYFAVTQKNLS
jgi:hypothetical protein